MHMADALISPAVGGTMWAASSALAVYSAARLRKEGSIHKAPMMGVLGAFVFSAQMINFTIPMTGSSGHLGGGLILAILLGPHAAFLAMFSILLVQALFFADGGLLALGCNVFNLGFFPCFVAYPFIYKPLAGGLKAPGKVALASIPAAVLGLQMGAMGVVLETTLSGISELPFGSFVILMLPIHLAIGIVEGIVTAGLVSFVMKARPEMLGAAEVNKPSGEASLKPLLAAFLAAAVVIGGFLSWFASTHPDGLEWSIFRLAGKEELEPSGGSAIHVAAAAIQEKTAFMPGYDFKGAESREGDKSEAASEKTDGGNRSAKEGGTARREPETSGKTAVAGVEKEKGSAASGKEEEAEKWPAVSAGTSLAGLVGAGMTLLIAALIGLALRSTGRPVSG